MHGPCEEVAVLTQHVGHPEGGKLRVRVGVEQAVVRQRVEGVTRLVLHEVQQGRVGVVGRCDGGDLVVFIPCCTAAASSSPSSSSATSSAAAAPALAGVALGKEEKDQSHCWHLRCNGFRGATLVYTCFIHLHANKLWLEFRKQNKTKLKKPNPYH